MTARTLRIGSLGLLVVTAALLAQLPDPAWRFDVLKAKNGRTFEGMVVEETPHGCRFLCVRRKPGAATVILPTTFEAAEILSVQKLDGVDRALLASRVQQLAEAGSTEKSWMRDLELSPVSWHGAPGGGLRYASEHFLLESNAREDIVRRAAVRLEQLFAAYARYLPPRRPTGQPPRIELVQSVAEYRRILEKRGHRFSQLAFYDASSNRILCASDLERLGADLERLRGQHKKVLEDLRVRESDLFKYYKGKPPPSALIPIHETRGRIENARRENEATFQKATVQLFQALGHEAFHAYLAAFVYLPAESDFPRWLNEGLAQMFGSAILEAGELRIYPDRERLRMAKEAIRKGEFPPLESILHSKAGDFLVLHGEDKAASDRQYVASWALAYYLTFGLGKLGSPELDHYAVTPKKDLDVQVSFQKFVGEPLVDFEKDFLAYMTALRSDGSVEK